MASASTFGHKMRIKLTIAYDGTLFKGWAKQPNLPTIQESIETALAEISGQPIQIYGSGRTDTGVHANAQVAHFDAPVKSSMKPKNWLPAMNSRLPPSIRVMNCEEVSEVFHARFSAQSKTYVYRLSIAPVLSPHEYQRAWHLPRSFNEDLLTQALGCYLGEHDFRNFSALRGNESSETEYVRTIFQANVEKVDNGYTLRYSGNGFLYKMVRILTGVAIQVAQERLDLGIIREMLENTSGSYSSAKYCAPSDGLFLEQVIY